MTSLIFWVPYTAHHVWSERRKEKRRVQNYERWEGLRDEYDEQRKTQSLDIQRTGAAGWGPSDEYNPRGSMDGYYNQPKPIITLRDQQEANDARTSWRPQEAWDTPRTQLQAQMTGQMQYIPPGPDHPSMQRHASAVPAYYPQQQQAPNALPLRAQKTGATWDEGLPARLQVSRRSYDSEEYSQRYRGTGSTPASNGVSRQNSVSRDVRDSRPSLSAGMSRTHTPSSLRTESTPVMTTNSAYHAPPQEVTHIVELPKNEFGFIEPAQTAVPGGRMAELLERGY